MSNSFSDINLIKPDTDLSKARNLNWDVTINGKPYDVYRVDDCVHRIGGRHGNNCLWCCPAGEKLTYENAIEYDGESARYSITATPVNYIKTKWDETSMERSVHVIIMRNDEVFYTFGCRDMSYGLAKAQVLITQIEEHPINFNDRNYVERDIIGRKIWWRNQPAIIESWIEGQACIIVKPDFDDGATRFKTPKYFENEDGMFDEDEETVKLDVLLDKEIWWFRD